MNLDSKHLNNLKDLLENVGYYITVVSRAIAFGCFKGPMVFQNDPNTLGLEMFGPPKGRASGGVWGSKHRYSQGIWKIRVNGNLSWKMCLSNVPCMEYVPIHLPKFSTKSQMLHVRNIYLHFPLHVAVFHLMQLYIQYNIYIYIFIYIYHTWSIWECTQIFHPWNVLGLSNLTTGWSFVGPLYIKNGWYMPSNAKNHEKCRFWTLKIWFVNCWNPKNEGKRVFPWCVHVFFQSPPFFMWPSHVIHVIHVDPHLAEQIREDHIPWFLFVRLDRFYLENSGGRGVKSACNGGRELRIFANVETEGWRRHVCKDFDGWFFASKPKWSSWVLVGSVITRLNPISHAPERTKKFLSNITF